MSLKLSTKEKPILNIVALCQGSYLGSIQNIDFSITREMAPVYTGTDSRPDYEFFHEVSRCKKRIAGSLIFYHVDYDVLSRILEGPIPNDECGPLWYPGQTPPFDILIVEKNEYNKLATYMIFKAELISGDGNRREYDTNWSIEPFIAQRTSSWVPVKEENYCICKSSDKGSGTCGPYSCFVCHGTGVNLEDYQAEPRDPHTIGRAGDPQIDRARR